MNCIYVPLKATLPSKGQLVPLFSALPTQYRSTYSYPISLKANNNKKRLTSVKSGQ